MKCVRIPGGGILSGPDVDCAEVVVNGKTVRFEFDKHFGPSVLTKNGDPAARQPSVHSPFWPAFKVWLKDYQEKDQIAQAMKSPKEPDKFIMLDMSAAGKVKRHGD